MKKDSKLYLASFCSLGLTAVAGSVLSKIPAKVLAVDTATTQATASVTVVDASCSMAGVTVSGNEHAATVSPGTYVSDIGLTTLTVTCNKPGGFAVYAVGFGDDTWGNTDMIYTGDGDYKIVTGTATSGNVSNWAMKVNAVAGDYAPTIENYYGNYHTVPTDAEKVASFPSATNSITGSRMTTTYAAFVSSAQVAGTYEGQVKYILVNPATAPAPSEPPKPFEAAFEAAGAVKVTAGDGQEYYQMQDMTASICSAVTAASSTVAADTQIGTLVDNRGDKKTYTVAKLLDGNCWMTENLRLGGSSAITLTSSDSEVTSNFTLPAHVSSWTSTYTAAMIHVSDDIDTVTNQYYGYYYNYYAASAGTVTNSGTVNASASICPKGWTLPDNYTQTANKSYSNLLYKYGIINNITDSGVSWPTGAFNRIKSAPLSFVLSGFHNHSGTTVYNRGSNGYYWSGTSNSAATHAYRLYFNSSNVYPQGILDKRNGFAVRCVAQ